ncbi:hypothetical protein [Vagococcus hydrophili]|uniref:Uncharacterized protein n=1 Tax=Vagococcus hydrophili TaxID=2714947 RepID=A0A6G8AS26_9ENTE|nr:hypothetical protein [Vagococcus hydrophili]QIL47725.1 hypothetical protein G7082_03815 [Vagococcus hydrophili]
MSLLKLKNPWKSLAVPFLVGSSFMPDCVSAMSLLEGVDTTKITVEKNQLNQKGILTEGKEEETLDVSKIKIIFNNEEQEENQDLVESEETENFTESISQHDYINDDINSISSDEFDEEEPMDNSSEWVKEIFSPNTEGNKLFNEMNEQLKKGCNRVIQGSDSANQDIVELIDVIENKLDVDVYEENERIDYVYAPIALSGKYDFKQIEEKLTFLKLDHFLKGTTSFDFLPNHLHLKIKRNELPIIVEDDKVILDKGKYLKVLGLKQIKGTSNIILMNAEVIPEETGFNYLMVLENKLNDVVNKKIELSAESSLMMFTGKSLFTNLHLDNITKALDTLGDTTDLSFDEVKRLCQTFEKKGGKILIGDRSIDSYTRKLSPNVSYDSVNNVGQIIYDVDTENYYGVNPATIQSYFIELLKMMDVKKEQALQIVSEKHQEKTESVDLFDLLMEEQLNVPTNEPCVETKLAEKKVSSTDVTKQLAENVLDMMTLIKEMPTVTSNQLEEVRYHEECLIDALMSSEEKNVHHEKKTTDVEQVREEKVNNDFEENEASWKLNYVTEISLVFILSTFSTWFITRRYSK